jgi:hypothetical protein
MTKPIRSVMRLMFAVVCLPAGAALAQAPALTHAVPGAVAPGQATDVTFFGANLAGVTGLWTSLPITAELAPGIEGNGTKADQVVYRITVAADAQVAIGGVRIATGQGISNVRLMMIDDLASTQKSGANKALATAQELAVPIAVDGACDAESFDYYKFAGKAGQRVSVEVLAQRLGSSLDPVVRLLDPNGKELAYSDDEAGVGIDSRLAFVPAADGVYTIEIHDIRYQGSAAHRYRMRLGNFPLVTTAYPLGAQRGTTSQITVAGPNAEFVPPLGVTMPPTAERPMVSLSARLPAGQGSAIVTLVSSGLPEMVETEPNDTPELGTPALLPAALNGRFAVDKDRDCFQFEAKAGQRLIFRGATRSLGSPADLFLRMYNAAGGLMAEGDDSGTDEGVLDVTFPADGVYRLVLSDLQNRGGLGYGYRVEVQPYQPGFSLTLEAEKFDAPKAGVFVAKVVSARRDYNGPIALEIQGAGEGFVLANNVIPEGQNEVVVNVTLPDRIEPGTPLVFNIVGRAKIGEADFTAVASSLTPLRTGLAGLPYPPLVLDGLLGLGIGPVFPDFFKLSADPLLLPQLIGASTVTVRAEKLNGFNDPIALAIEGLPAGVTATAAPIEKDKAEVAIAVAGPVDLPEGEHKFQVTGTAVFQNQPKKVVLGEAVLRVVKPLVVSAAPAGPIAINGKQKVKVTANRFGENGPIALAFKNLPTGITAPEGTVIPEGMTEVEVELSAAADAAVGRIENLVVAASTKVKETDVAVESPPVAFEVVAAQ